MNESKPSSENVERPFRRRRNWELQATTRIKLKGNLITGLGGDRHIDGMSLT